MADEPAKDQRLSTLFREVMWPLVWRSTLICATGGLAALAMAKYLRGPKNSDSPAPPPPV